MLSLLAVAPLFAGASRVCAATDATASARASWELLGVRSVDDSLDDRAGGSFARAVIEPDFGGTRVTSACPVDDGSRFAIASDRTMLEVDLPGSCEATVEATAAGRLEGWALADPGALRAEAGGRASLGVSATPGAHIGADGGAGGSFDAAWMVRSAGPETLLTGTVTVSLDDAYAGARLSMPGVAEVEASDGWVEASVRREGRWVSYSGPAPVTLEIRAALPGRANLLCASGSASSGGIADGDDPSFERGARLALDLRVLGVGAPHWIDADLPLALAACGCR